MSNVKHTMIFPTTISTSNIALTEQEKETIFDIVEENLNDDGRTMDFLGYSYLHHDNRLSKYYTSIVNMLKEHFAFLNLDPEELEIHIVKSWFNLSNNDKVNSKHNHHEAHYSFTFYANVPEVSKRFFRVYRKNDEHPNEFYPGVFSNTCKRWDLQNAVSWTFLPEEGDVFLFPASIMHDTASLDFKANNQDVAEVSSREDIKNSRICIGGDVVVTSKTNTRNHRLLQPFETWRKF